MTAPVYTSRNPPPAPERDLWWEAQRRATPDTHGWTARHRRGVVRLPYDVQTDLGQHAGALVDAWVCCDPACAGVELSESLLQLNHACCGVAMCHGRPTFEGALPQRRGEHRRPYIHSRGWFHGPFTAWWEPDAGGAR